MLPSVSPCRLPASQRRELVSQATSVADLPLPPVLVDSCLDTPAFLPIHITHTNPKAV